MTVLQIEYKVPDYDEWKQAFDKDPVGRKKLGVKRYRVFRTTNDPNHVVIDLEFENQDTAQQMLESLKPVWTKFEGNVLINPHARFLKAVDYKEYD